jgi:hypothetical protein
VLRVKAGTWSTANRARVNDSLKGCLMLARFTTLDGVYSCQLTLRAYIVRVIRTSSSSYRYRPFSTITMEASRDVACDFVEFLNASPTPFHAVRSVKERLIGAGFEEIKERDCWSSVCRPGGKYYLTRNASAILAFAIGNNWEPGNPVAMIGAHTDSPCLRVKPVSKGQSEGFLQVGVETYGGGLWHTW